MTAAILLIHCQDQPGLVAQITGFIHQHGGNILDLDQHTDADNQQFFMRLVWDTTQFALSAEAIATQFAQAVAIPLKLNWQLYFTAQPLRMAIFVSRELHCLYDILARCQAAEWQVQIPIIISNHESAAAIAAKFEIPCQVLPVTAANKAAQEAAIHTILQQQQIDCIVLARYMQILSAEFVQQYAQRIINIHHSFLPAFPGGRPYHAAHQRGVKIIGATSHYVTAELDAGPIIAQDVTTVSHRDTVADMIRKGRDLEKQVLSRAVWLHLQRKILVNQNKTIVFD